MSQEIEFLKKRLKELTGVDVDMLAGPFTCKHDPKYVGGACAACHADSLEKLEAANLRVEELKKALYAECRGEACNAEECYGGYRRCSGCEARAKKAFGPGWGDVIEKSKDDAKVTEVKLKPGETFPNGTWTG